ncbi:MAG TPA: mechanosensitive ion channel domain-containing protein [Acidobacteriaceae bacterium]|nr:mechanosensitive ion channel domain-containing protein [Acidobacteriaceae bacterium]
MPLAGNLSAEIANIMFLFDAPAQGVPYVDGYGSFRDIVRDWHHDTLLFVHKDLPKLVFILIFWGIILRIVLFFVARMRRIADHHAKTAPQRASELRTVAAILRASAYGVAGFIILLHVLSVFGINLTPLLASAGVVGVGIGLGAQSLFKDMLNGIFILIENQYNVGDTVTLASLTGTVEDLSLRLTTLRDANGALYFIPNSQIATVSNLSRDYAVGTLNLTVDATADPDKVLRVLRQTAMAVRNDPQFKDSAVADPDVPGVDAISGRVVTYPVTVRVRISRKDALMRELRRRILQAFEQNGIPLGTDPANMLMMKHNGPGANDPTAPPAQQPLTGT